MRESSCSCMAGESWTNGSLVAAAAAGHTLDSFSSDRGQLHSLLIMNKPTRVASEERLEYI